MKILYYDLETTGVKHWRNGIHQLAGILEVDGEVVEEFDHKVAPNPQCKIEDEALAIGGVDFNTVINYPPMKQIHTEFTTMLQEHVDRFDKWDKIHLCGYNNASFDNNFLRAWFVQNHDKYFGSYFWSSSLDVMVLAADHLKSVRHTMENFKLGTVAKFMGIEVVDDNLHDGLYDVKLTREIYLRISQEKGSRIMPSKVDHIHPPIKHNGSIL